MPIYEYQCESCEKLTEAIQRMDEPRLTICPHCGGPLKKLMSAPSFQFKGTGWYVTDYARKSDGGGEAETSSSESSATDKGASKEGASKGKGDGKSSAASS